MYRREPALRDVWNFLLYALYLVLVRRRRRIRLSFLVGAKVLTLSAHTKPKKGDKVQAISFSLTSGNCDDQDGDSLRCMHSIFKCCVGERYKLNKSFRYEILSFSFAMNTKAYIPSHNRYFYWPRFRSPVAGILKPVLVM